MNKIYHIIIHNILYIVKKSRKKSETLKRFMLGLVLQSGGEEMTDFEKIYSEYFPGVYRYVFSLCRDETEAEEITQEAFCKAMEKLDAFKGECSVFSWLCQIAKNTYFTLHKKQKKYVPESESAADSRDFEREFMDGETAAELYKFLHRLDEPYKEVFMLRVFGELPFLQIGELFGKSDGWARLVFYRAKKELWRRINEIDM